MFLRFSEISEMFQRFSEMFWRCFRDCQRCFNDYSKMFQKCFRDDSRILRDCQRFPKIVQRCFNGFHRFPELFSEVVQRFSRDVYQRFQRHWSFIYVSGMFKTRFWAFLCGSKISQTLSENVQRMFRESSWGRFRELPLDSKDYSNIFLKFFRDESREFQWFLPDRNNGFHYKKCGCFCHWNREFSIRT